MTKTSHIVRSDINNKWHDYACNATSRKATQTLNASYATEADALAAFSTLPKKMQAIHEVRAGASTEPIFTAMPRVLAEAMKF